MFCGNSVIIGMIILLVVGYLVVYGSSSTTIREGLSPPPCPKNWWSTESQTKGLCVQTCPSDSQTRDANGRCKCGLGAPNQSCVAGTVCVNNVCIAEGAKYGPTGHPTYKALGPGKCASNFGRQVMTKHPGIDQCSRWCQDDPTCKSFSYQNDNTQQCLKSTVANCPLTTDAFPWTSYALGPPDKTGKAPASPSTMKCPGQFPHLLEYAPQKSFFCFKNSDGNTTGEGGLCNCNCSNCGYNNNFENCTSVARQASCSGLCPVDAGLAYLADGPAPACIAMTSTYLANIRAATVAHPKGMAFGQQSNGCWHILQWDPTASGANKKTQAMYPKYFEVVRSPTAAQCQAATPPAPQWNPTAVRGGGVNLDGRYAEGNPLRYTGGWALRNGPGGSCDALCTQQPECTLPGNTCTSTAYTNPSRCYCDYSAVPPPSNPKKIIHWVGDCNQCSRSWCTGGPKNTGTVISNELANKLYSVGSPLSTWGCQNVTADSEQVSIRAQDNALTKTLPAGSLARGGIFVIESPHPKCSSIKCPTGDSMPNASKLCSGPVCQNEECCTRNPVCTSSICSGSMLKLKGSMVGSTILDQASCTAAGGTSYAYCPDNDIHYCAGPCTGTQSCTSNSGLKYDACPKPAQLTTDVPVIISNPSASQPYLQMGTPSNALTHSSTKNANFIFRNVNQDTGHHYPLNYTDKVIIQWAALNNGGRSVDQPDGNTPGCGWYGCRVLQPPDATNSSLNPTFDHGGPDPAVFMLMAPPEYVKTDSNFNGPIYNGAPFCLQYAGSLTTGYDVNWGYTPNCGWFGCRILSDYLGQRPDLGEFGWDHGAGQDVAGGGPTGYPQGPTVFTIEAPTESGVPCAGTTCTTGECCVSLATCDNYTCDARHTKKGGSITCAGATCTINECCTPNPTCGTYPCGTGYHPKTNPAGITCTQTPCAQGECCDLNPTCANPSYKCPTDEHLKSNPAGINCKGATCTDPECCGMNPVCSTFSCPESDFYHTYAPVPNASNVYCKEQTCTQTECCTATPTDSGPLVQTWPLYPQNYTGKSTQF